LTLLAALGFTPALQAQSSGQQQQSSPPSLKPQDQTEPAAQQEQKPAAQGPVDPEEEKVYKAFVDAKPDAFDQQIQAGEQYLQKYPNGTHAEQVYSRLTNAYYQKQQLDKMFAAGDKALAIN